MRSLCSKLSDAIFVIMEIKLTRLLRSYPLSDCWLGRRTVSIIHWVEADPLLFISGPTIKAEFSNGLHWHLNIVYLALV